MPATRCGPSSSCWPRSGPRCASSSAPRPTGPSWLNDSSTRAALLAAPATADDVAVRRLVLLARAVAEGRLAPRSHGVASGRCRALTTAVRVVDRVHGGATRLRALAQVTRATGLADRDVLVVGVADRAHGRAALGRDHAHLAGVEAQSGRTGLLRDDLDGGAGSAAQLAAATGMELDVVDDRTRRDVRQRERAAGTDVRARPGLDDLADLQARRRKDVALFAVGVVQQRDVGRAVRVVLDGRDLGRDAVLAPLEVDLAVAPLGAAATVAGRDAAVRVAATRLRDALDERLLGLGPSDLLEVGPRREATTGAGWLVLLQCHLLTGPFEELDRVVLVQLDDRLLPLARAPCGEAAPLRLGADVDGAHVLHAHAEDLLDGLADLRLVRLRVDAERVLVRGQQRVGLLADDRLDQDLARVHEATPVRCSSAVGVTTRRVAPITSATPTLSQARTDTPWMLRKLFAQFASSLPTTTRMRPARSPSASAAALVDGVSNACGSQTASEPRSA